MAKPKIRNVAVAMGIADAVVIGMLCVMVSAPPATAPLSASSAAVPVFASVGDMALPRDIAQAAPAAEGTAEETRPADEALSELPVEDAAYEEPYWEDTSWYDESYDYGWYDDGGTYIEAGYYGDGTDAPYGEYGPTREMPGYHDGRKETYYSSNVLYHSRTGEWSVDEDGFYHDDQGRYVVGVGISEGYQIGDEIETGRGTAVVMDYGYTENITDFYTNW